MARVRSKLLPLQIKPLVHPAILEGILEVQHFLPWNESGCPKPQSFSDTWGRCQKVAGVGKREDKNYFKLGTSEVSS